MKKFVNLFDHFLSWLYIRRLYGPRCPEYADGCYCCEKWKDHDEIFNQGPNREDG